MYQIFIKKIVNNTTLGTNVLGGVLCGVYVYCDFDFESFPRFEQFDQFFAVYSSCAADVYLQQEYDAVLVAHSLYGGSLRT